MKRLLNCKWTVHGLVLFSAAVLFVEYHAGRNIRLAMLYVLPVALSAWCNQKGIAYTLAVLLPCIRLSFFVHWNEMDDFSYGVFNATVRIVVLIFVARLADLARQTVELGRRITVLESILPMCSSCRRIRNTDGAYEQLETYLSKYSQTRFSHGICPDCMSKLYPEYPLPSTNRRKEDGNRGGKHSD